VGAQVTITNVATGDARTLQTNDHGFYVASLLPPGQYTVEITKKGFKTASLPEVQVIVAETKSLSIGLQPGAVTETVTVATSSVQLQTESSDMGRVTDSQMIENLPLAARNYTQIIGLNPGVSQELNNAGTLGKGGGTKGGVPSGGSIISQGATSNDNNFQINGLPANDIVSAWIYSAGIPVPNPDTIQEFKVQTAQYDATQGRNAGAVVNVVTKTGTNEYHATLWEYFRNEVLNANDWFAKNQGQPRPVLRQNQYGLTAAGPVIKNKILAFGSWQGTKQLNALDPANHKLDYLPPLTDDRSIAGLGAAFAGDVSGYGSWAGVVNANGTVTIFGVLTSPMASQAVKLLQLRLPNGKYLVPTPQHIDASQPNVEIRGSSFLSEPGTFGENQWMANADYLQSDRNKIAFRYFGEEGTVKESMLFNTLGFPLYMPSRYDIGSVTDTFILSPNMVNQFAAGLNRSTFDMHYDNAFKFSDLSMNVPAQDDAFPLIWILGSFETGVTSATFFGQDEYTFTDILSWTKGKHQFNFGGGFMYGRNHMSKFDYQAYMIPLTWADFLVGQSFAAYGVPYSSIYWSQDGLGDLTRDWRYKNTDAFIQDDYRITKRLTVNLGLRYERIGDLGAANGTGNIDISALDPNPPSSGSLAGVIVSSNYKGPALPAGVVKGKNTFGINGDGQGTWNPRLGFSWMLPGADRFVLRGGAGMYHTTIAGILNLQLAAAQPYSGWRVLVGSFNAAATDAQPFGPAPAYPAPVWTPYSASTSLTTDALTMNFRPPTTYHFSLGLQSRLPGGAILDVSYAGARDLHTIAGLSVNQAGLASASHPIRGVTTNTLANLSQRAPYIGFTTNSMWQLKTANSAWFNALEASLSQQWKHRLQYQASYTWTRLLSLVPGFTAGTNQIQSSGDQLNWKAGYGPDPNIRPQRFVLSAFYALPGPAASHRLLANTLGGWTAATATIIQDGHQLPVSYTNNNSVYGESADRASFASGCTAKNLPTTGSDGKRALNGWLNTACLAHPAAIGDDGSYGFGNTPNGVFRGPDQVVADISLGKAQQMRWPKEGANATFRADFFNAFNHPSFGNPNSAYATSTFGLIGGMSTNPRVIQFSLKYSF
jgi:hypothetical protein